MTPLQKQYNQIKAEYPDTILFFRMGDFYEGFGEDAKIMAKVLGITLTSRNKKKDDPMAGVPHHALDAYMYKMVMAGYKVAICEQLENPKDAKGIVKRGVIKVVTPGTITDEKAVDVTSNNYICALNIKDGLCGISYADLNTGEFKTTEIGVRNEVDKRKVIDEINRLSPSEILIPTSDQEEFKQEYKQLLGYYLQFLEDEYFDEKDGEEEITEFFKVKSLKGFGIENRLLCISTSGALVKYLVETQKAKLAHINKISQYNISDHMMLDTATMKNLELVFSSSTGGKRGTLIGVIDKTQTSMGARLLRSWVLMPLIDKEKINERLEAVEAFVSDPEKNDRVQELLGEVYDLERLASKLGSSNANAKDLVALKHSLQKIPELANHIPEKKTAQAVSSRTPIRDPLLSKIKEEIKTDKFNSLIDLLEKSLNTNPPAFLNEGGLIRDGYNAEIDEIKEAAKGGKTWLKNLQAQEIERTGITSLKVKFNKVFGYFIEISKSNLDKVPEEYIRKQTLVNAERFITPELKEMEDKILGAEEKMIEMEYRLFVEIRTEAEKYIKDIQILAYHVAILDVIAGFAHLARYNNYVKPELNGEGEINIKDGRHPVVEELSDEPFIPNDVKLNKEDHQLIILTSPNMAGKSTYIRQVALIVLMAQIGCFVPAKKAKIGVTDRIFTRVGASDNLAQGESTFMVEMNETANILNNATERSLIILDEVGRGTSTYDGVSIAWAVAEHLHNKVGALTLFATHYHELIKLEQTLEKAKNYNVAVKETVPSCPRRGEGEVGDTLSSQERDGVKSADKGQVLFLRKIIPGGTDQSYGVHVAEMAGIPDEVIAKANEILAGLEQESMFEIQKLPLLPEEGLGEVGARHSKEKQPAPVQPSLFSAPDPRWEKMKKEFEEIDINNMTPIDALKKLEEMKDNLK